jgi:hypothetical protein
MLVSRQNRINAAIPHADPAEAAARRLGDHAKAQTRTHYQELLIQPEPQSPAHRLGAGETLLPALGIQQRALGLRQINDGSHEHGVIR